MKERFVVFGMHDLGLLTVCNDKIILKINKEELKSPMVLLDICTGSLLKVGNKRDVDRYFRLYINSMESVSGAKDVHDADFGTLHCGIYKLDVEEKYPYLNEDEVCTLLNFLHNSLDSELLRSILMLSEEGMHLYIKNIQKVGW